MFELLPPQRAALLEQGLLDQAKTAVGVDLPTSGGKTLLAQFRMLQALNHFRSDMGWIAYVAPTKALTSQLARRLRRDFDPIGIRVEPLTAAVEVDAIEEQLLTNREQPFDVLVATPEKLGTLSKMVEAGGSAPGPGRWHFNSLFAHNTDQDALSRNASPLSHGTKPRTRPPPPPGPVSWHPNRAIVRPIVLKTWGPPLSGRLNLTVN